MNEFPQDPQPLVGREPALLDVRGATPSAATTLRRIWDSYSPHTRVAYRTDLGQFLEFLGVDRQRSAAMLPSVVAQIGQDHVASWIDQLRSDGKAASTISRKVAALRSVFRHLAAVGWCSRNPASGRRFRIPVTRRHPARVVPSEKEIRALVSVAVRQAQSGGADQVRDLAVILLLVTSGLRVSDVTEMRVDAWSSSVERRSGARIVVTLRKGRREAPVTVAPVAAAWIDRYLEQRRRAGDEWDVDAPLFARRAACGSAGKPVSRNALWRLVRRLGAEAGIEGLHPHRLRHAAATHALDAGAPIEDVADLLGHASTRTTRIYDARVRESTAWRALAPLAEEAGDAIHVTEREGPSRDAP